MGKRLLLTTEQFSVATIILIAILVGLSLPAYVGAMDDSIARSMALPALLFLGLLLLYSRILLLMLILLFRSSGDVIFESTRFSLGAMQIGVGGLINVFVILIALLLVIEKPSIVPKKMLSMWVPFLILALAGVVISPVKGDAIRVLLALISYFAIFVSAFYVVRSPDDFKRCVRLILWSSVLPAMYALVDIALHGGTGGPNGARLQSTFSHPNIFAFYLTLVVSLGFYVLKSDTTTLSKSNRLVLTAYTFFMLALLMLTQTRSAWIACFSLFAAYGLFFERRYLLYLFLAPLFALLIPSVRDRLLDLGAGNEVVQYAKLNSFAWRVYLWESAFNWMRPANYLLGYGLDSFQHYSPTFFPLAGKTNFNAHNLYVQWIFELGALGLFAYLWLFGRLLWLLRKMLPINKLGGFILILLVIQYLMVSFSDNMAAYLAFNWYFWFIAGSACAVVAADLKLKSDQDTRHERGNKNGA
ncbi:MAG: O-antigen ligase family protein [Glaciimonas sp.]|nr:O-antigen ligase family protein [Glaciimonas sp.]